MGNNDNNLLNLIIRAKDEYSGIFSDYQQKVSTLPDTEAEVNARWQGYMNDAQTYVNKLTNDRIAIAKREKDETLALLKQYHTQGLISEKQFNDGVIAADKKATEAAKQYAEEISSAHKKATDSASDPSVFDKIKGSWIALTIAVAAAWATVNEALEYVDIGAKALQAEAAFANVVNAYAVDGDRLIAKLKEVSVSAIDDSDLMQASMKALQQGLNPDQIVSLMEVARSSARIAGIDIKDAFDQITAAAANQQTRGLKSLGIVIDQGKAFEAYAEKIGVATDALNEQQKSAAIADAAIVEGMRQRAAMGDMLENEAERLQQVITKYHEMKEAVGKDLVHALMVASDNTLGLGVAFTAASLTQAPAIIARIVSAYEALAVAANAATLSIPGVAVAIAAAAAAFAAFKAIEAVAMSDVNKLLDDIAEQQKFLGPKLAANTMLLQDLGFKGAAAQREFNAAVREGTVVFDEATRQWINAQKVADDFYAAEEERKKRVADANKYVIAMNEAAVNSYQATAAFEIALLEQQYDQQLITLTEYFDKKQALEYESSMKSIESMEATLEMLKLDMEKNRDEIVKIEAQINDEMLKYAELKYKTEDDYAKKSAKSEEDKFKNWEALQAKQLAALDANLALADAKDAAAAARGEITQVEVLTRKAARDAEYYDAQLKIADETLQKVAVLHNADSAEYAAAMAAKEKLQNDYKIKTIQSEEEIRQEKIKQITEVAEKHVLIAVDELDAIAVKRTAALAFEQDLLNQGLISHAEYAAKVKEIEAQASADREAQLNKEHAARLTGLLNYIAQFYAYLDDVANRVSDAFSTEHLFDNLVDGFSDAKQLLTMDYYSMMNEVSVYTKDRVTNLINMIGNYGTGVMKQVYLFGRDVTNLADEQISEWADQVAEHVHYVQSLFASLQDTINSYQDQLDQMQGNETAILERWHQEQIDNLKEKYGEALRNTKEYQEALTLIEELYAEKRKNIAEDEQTEKDKIRSGGGDPVFKNPYTSLIPEASNPYDHTDNKAVIDTAVPGGLVQKIQGNVLATVELKGDVQSADRYVKEFLMPAIKRQLALEGIVLKPA